MNNTKQKVYIYTRVSTTMQVDGYSLDAQKTRMKAYAEFNGFEIVGEYEDAGKSGKSIEGRMEFNRMMEDIKTGKDENRQPIYRHVSFSTFKDEVNCFGAGMLKLGHLDKRIAIIGKNSYEWYMSYFAVLCGLGIVVPLDKGLPYEETENSLIKSQAKVILFITNN